MDGGCFNLHGGCFNQKHGGRVIHGVHIIHI